MEEPLLSIRGLVTEFHSPDEGVLRAVNDVGFDLRQGETLGVVGESGSGKSVTMMSILGLLSANGRVVGGEAVFEGRDLLRLSDGELREVRGGQIGMIFQDPMTSLNPVLTVGDQIMEAILIHQDVTKQRARERAVALLENVGVANAAARVGDYPHQFSGGMRQRVMIAMAMANDPRLLIADEPTTALDVTVQAQVLDLLRDAQQQSHASTILITHDLGLVAEMADRVVVMYGGRVVETGTVDEIFREPRHPYTVGLLSSMPRLDDDVSRLQTIPGQAPSLAQLPSGCVFHPRCFLMQGRELCRTEEPPLYDLEDPAAPRGSRCHFHEELTAHPSDSTSREPRTEGRAE